MAADELAKQVAEWMLVVEKKGTVDFSANTDVLSEFRQYFFTNKRYGDTTSSRFFS
jgi:hypothetical protein